MNNLNKYSNKYKKYAFRKIGKFFGSCAVATVITLSGAAIMAPNVAVYASSTDAGGDNDIHNLPSSSEGYEVIIPKGKIYRRNDKKENTTPELIEEGYNGRSFILPKEGEEGYFFDHPMSELFTKLYDKNGDGEIDDKYKDPKYPHVVDSGLTDDSESSSNKPGVWEYNPDGKYENSDGVIDESDNIVVARKPFTIDENAEENVVKDDGSVVLTGNYKIHVNEGDHIEAKDDVYEVGTKPKVEETPIPFTTRYEKDNDSPKGKETEMTPGVDGKTVTTTTYEVDPNTGKVTENPSTSETTDPVTRVVKIGAQPKVEETPIPFTTRYEKDNDSPKGKETEVTPGVDGKTVTTTTYTVDPNTGKVTENPSTPVTTDPVTRVVKVGTQPKVEKTPIPFETRYEDDNSIPEGEEREVTAGVNGETVKTTTYEINPDTGVVTANEPTTKTTDPVTRVVKRGTKPKVEETPGNPQSEQPGEGTPENPQPEQPGAGTPETPQPEQPGEETTNGDKPTDKPTEGTPSVDKPTEGTSSSTESSTSHSTTPSSSSSTSTPEKPSKAETPGVRTVWRDENGKELKSPSTDKQEAGEFEGYEFVESHREGDNVTVHVFRAKKTATNTPNEKTTQPEEKQVAVATVTSDKKEEETLSSPTSERVELPNTGTVTNGFFTAEVATILAGLGILIPGVKKKETEE